MSVSCINTADGNKTPAPRSQSITNSAPAVLHHTNSTPVTLTLTNATASDHGAVHSNIPSTSTRPENSPYPKPFLPEQNSTLQNNQLSSQKYGLRGTSSQRSSLGGGMRMTQPNNVRGILIKHHTTISSRQEFQARAQHAQSFNALLAQHTNMMSERSQALYHDQPKSHYLAIPHNGQPLPSRNIMMPAGHPSYIRGTDNSDNLGNLEEIYDCMDDLSHSMEEEKIQQLRNVSFLRSVNSATTRDCCYIMKLMQTYLQNDCNYTFLPFIFFLISIIDSKYVKAEGVGQTCKC